MALNLSITFCNADTWSNTNVMKKEIEVFGTNCYHCMLGIRRINRVRNEEVIERVRQSNLGNLMYKCQLESLGHLIWKDDIITRLTCSTTVTEEEINEGYEN